MTAVLLVGVALGAVCAYVWSAIVQAEGPPDAGAVRAPIGPRTIAAFRHAQRRIVDARQQRREERFQQALESGPRRLRFEETAELTVPLSSIASSDAEPVGRDARPSRVLSAVQLVLLILLVGGVIACVVLGVVRAVAQTVGH
ncbi:MAG: hypothetical protein ABR518_02610 [Actinomycetota bacterium]